MNTFPDAGMAVKGAGQALYNYGYEVQTEKWHGRKNDHYMLETLNYSFTTPCPMGAGDLVASIQPNMPWAEDHFKERVAGNPVNPGEQYKNWPFYQGKPENDTHRVEEEKFSHTYMERFWTPCLKGIRFNYGNLLDVLGLLGKEPLTRQAYLPVWFPEDTGGKVGRIPCTLGYWFVMRHFRLHCTYYIRSCDYFRHLRDDIYLAMRLQQWVLGKLSTHLNYNKAWVHVTPGMFTMHIGSLHCFKQEKGLLLK